MIDLADTAVASAVAQAVGHPGPFTGPELSGLTHLRVAHAHSLSELKRCPGLTHLELIGCAVRTLIDVADLDQLVSLRVLGCPIEDVEPLAGHRSLTDLGIDFSFVQDISPLTGIRQLRSGRFVGNPLAPSSWNEIRPAWQRSTDSESRPRLLEFGPTEAWEVTRTMWEHGIGLSFALLDGVRPVLVRPGLPRVPGLLIDSCQTVGAGLLVAAEQGETTDALFRRKFEFAASKGRAVPTDFASHRIFGDRHDAREWVQTAPADERDWFTTFLDRFPGQVFFREEVGHFAALEGLAGVPVPAGLVASRSVLAGTLADQGADFRLDRFAGNSPRGHTLASVWFYPNPGVYSGPDRRRLFLGEAGLFPLAEWIETGRSILAAKIGTGDPAIYEFSEHDLNDAQFDGRPIGDSVYRVFSSHAELLAHISGYRLPDGALVESAKHPDQEG